MACKSVCRLCPRLVISQAVTFAAGALTINLPAGSYRDGCKYCIVVAQAIPDAATITAPVVITIGTGTGQRIRLRIAAAHSLRRRTSIRARVMRPQLLRTPQVAHSG